MDGWISLHRSVMEHWVWRDPIKLKWWLDILLTVNHKDNKVNIGNQLISCDKGQSVMSLSNWGKRWGVSKHAVNNFFTLLVSDGMILRENLTKTTRITVCNYSNYQNCGNDAGTMRDTNNNDNNNKERNNKERKKGETAKRFTPPSLDELEKHISEKGYSVDAESFMNFYQSKDWMVGKNKMKDWRAALVTWERRKAKERNTKPEQNETILPI